MADHSVVIAGAGPTGLMLAGELALAGVDVAVVERRPSQELSGRTSPGPAHARYRSHHHERPAGIIGFLYDAGPVLLDLAAPSGIDILRVGPRPQGQHRTLWRSYRSIACLDRGADRPGDSSRRRCTEIRESHAR